MAKNVFIITLVFFIGVYIAAAIPLHHRENREVRSFPSIVASSLPPLDKSTDEYYVCHLISLLKLSEHLVSFDNAMH